MSEKELTQEELEKAAGGKRKMQANQGLNEAGSTGGSPAGSGSSNDGGPSIGGVEPLPDPPYDPR